MKISTKQPESLVYSLLSRHITDTAANPICIHAYCMRRISLTYFIELNLHFIQLISECFRSFSIKPKCVRCELHSCISSFLTTRYAHRYPKPGTRLASVLNLLHPGENWGIHYVLVIFIPTPFWENLPWGKLHLSASFIHTPYWEHLPWGQL